MAASWGDFFTRVGKATLAGLEIAAVAMSRVEVAFDANAQRGCGIIWLPRAKQVLYYTIRWSSKLNLYGKSELEIQLINVFLGLSMWSGLINANRAVRDPAIKIGINVQREIESLGGRNEDAKTLWTMIENIIDGICTNRNTSEYDRDDETETKHCWDYVVGYQALSEDSKFKLVKRLSSGQTLIPSSGALGSYNLVEWNPAPVLAVALCMIPDTYIN